jgi:hypothetical protein
MRNYNKLYTLKNQKGGPSNLFLGYQLSTKEIEFQKDKETYFHVPSYTNSITINNSFLIENGATGGPFPAASDRIYKSRKNYGNTTNYGNPSDVADATWFCTWLYKDENGKQQWMDRYYNPGQYLFAELEIQLYIGLQYQNNEKIFRDVPSTMVFEPGVLYKYFHVGEQTAENIVNTFNGLSSQHLVMQLSSWGNQDVDVSSNNLPVTVTSSVEYGDLYKSQDSLFFGRAQMPIINLKQPVGVEIVIDWDPSYTSNCTNEHTLSMWFQSDAWKNNQTTQLAGNFSSKGGYGLFLESLDSYPFFIIPETNKGHILFVNQNGIGILDKPTTVTQIPAVPKLIGIDSNDHVVVCYNDSSGTIFKLDSTGTIIASTKSVATSANFLFPNEKPIHLLCGQNDDITVITNKAEYYFDTNLKLKSTTIINTSLSSVAAYSYDLKSSQATLIIADGLLDLKYTDTSQWSISATDTQLYKDDTVFVAGLSGCKTIQIDPLDRIWVLYNNNQIAVIDPTNPINEIAFQFTVGSNTPKQKHNLSFIHTYDQSTKQTKWLAVVHFANESIVYFLDLNGRLIKTLNINSFYNLSVLESLNQASEDFQYLYKGDFTGYEFKRIFKKLAPYNNQQQLVLKASVKDKAYDTSNYSIFKSFASIENWEQQSWQHLAITLKNNTFSVYNNAKKISQFSFPGNYELSYEQQPPFFIGSSVGSKNGANKENGIVVNIFNGLIGEIKMLNYSLDQSKIEMFLRKEFLAENLYWSLPVPAIQYVETLERFFKNKVPGHKSTFYSVNLAGTNIQDVQTRKLIEEQLLTIVSEIAPIYTNLVKFNWV